MGFWRQIFGPSKEEVWREVAEQVGARYVEGSMWWGGERVQLVHRDWIITLDTYTVSSGKSSVTFTRFRAPFINPDCFRFEIRRSSFLYELGKWFGMQDVEIGHADFDRDYIVKVGDPNEANLDRVRKLLANERIRQLIAYQPAFHLIVKDDEGWFKSHFPDGVDELWFHVVGVIKEKSQLQQLFDLFVETLQTLQAIDAEGQPELYRNIDAVLAPGGIIQERNSVMWDGNLARRRAAEELARLKDARAVPALRRALSDEDPLLRASACQALGAIGDRTAIPDLVALLGDGMSSGQSVLYDYPAARALIALTARPIVEAFAQFVEGDEDARRRLSADLRPQVIRALMSMVSPDDVRALKAAQALAVLGAIEALEVVRSTAREMRISDDEVRQRWDDLVARFEALAALPRPAEQIVEPAPTLPRPAEEDMVTSDTLPKASGGESPTAA